MQHIKQLQDALGPDQELEVTCFVAAEKILVREIVVPNWHVLTLRGIDGQKNETSCIMDMHTVQLACKTVKITPPQKPVRIGFQVMATENQQP